ncbi:CHAT domain-containing protein [Acidisphaera sp. S103]|uniref:CHAT domain-containing protein n=1 Tax=Acidisphaera sp. S103 TaxID=1747223 RepID=UPI00131B7FA6|nr:CHAT domain-containing protein [Acidisphaera sp. S103]
MTDRTDLTITVASKKGRRRLLFQAIRTGSSASFPLSPDSENKLVKLREALPKKLQRFHTSIAGLQARDDAAARTKRDNAIAGLRAIGQEFLKAILIEDDDRPKLDAIMREAFPLHPTGRANPGRIDLVVFKRGEMDLLGLPVEILPIMDPRGVLNIGGPGIPDLEQALLPFPAFSAVVARRIGAQFDPRTKLERVAGGKIPVKIIRNPEFHPDDDTSPLISEVNWLREETETYEVENPWPEDDVQEKLATEMLGVCLLEPRASFAEHRGKRSWADQIQHFSCHYTSQDDGLEVLGIRGEPTPLNIAVSHLSSLMSDEIQYRRTIPDGLFPGPVIFLNACNSAGVDRHGGLSIVELLLRETKARAVVATSTPVESSLASTFALAVYEGLKDALSLGEAVLKARWTLVDNKTPFGILYLIYGNPDLRLEPMARIM